MPWETTDNYIRSGHKDPNLYSTCRTTSFEDKLPKGIKAVYCKRKDNGEWETQSFLFPLSEGWNEAEAKVWFNAHSKEINKRLIEFLVRDLIKSGEMPAMIVKSPYGKMARESVVNLIVKTREYKKYVGEPIALAEEDGKIYAMITLNAPIRLNKKQFGALMDKHNITEEELEKWEAENKEWKNTVLFGYPFKIVKEFNVPIEFYIPPDTKDWVEGVNIVKMRIEDITADVLVKASNEDLLDVHNKIHDIWNLLKKIDITEKRLITADLIIKKHALIQYTFATRDLEHIKKDILDDTSEEKLNKIIRKEGDKYVLYSHDGKVLGKHDSEKGALDQEKAIEAQKHKFDKFIPICKADDEKRVVYGEVLVPDVFDAHGDKITAEEIEKACHWFMENSQENDVMHKGDAINSQIVENYIAPQDLEFTNPKGEKVKVTKGTWVMGTKIYDEAIWKQVKEGKLNGFSIGGLGFKEEIPEGENQ